MEKITIVTSVDKNYVQHAGVMLCSLFENNPSIQIKVYFFHKAVDNEYLTQISILTDKYKQEIIFKEIDLENIDQFFVSGHITLAAYFRIFIPAYIQEDIHKLLYLDADIIINGDIMPLFKINIDDYFIAAAENVTPDQKEIIFGLKNNKYFNDGVMLINLRKWRQHQIMQKTLLYIANNKNKIKYHDQDALNVILNEGWLPLHPKFNMQGALFMDEFKLLRGNPEEIEEAILNPLIIHYSTPLKPWHYLSFHPYRQKYFEYLFLTPWKHFKPTDRNFVRIIRKATRPFLKRMGIKKIFGKHLY